MKYLPFLRACAAACIVLCVSGTVEAQKLKPIGPAPANQTVAFDVFLPLQNTDQLDQLITDLHTSGSPDYQHWITPQEFQTRFGPDPQTIAQVAKALSSHGLTVTAAHSHGVHVQGSVASVQSAFGVTLSTAVATNGAQRLVTSQALKLPAALTQAGANVSAFSPAIRQHVHSRSVGIVPDSRYSATGPYWFDDIKQAYSFPSYQSLNGKGATIGIVMSSDILDSDLALYFGHEKLAPPHVKRVLVDGGAPFDLNNDALFEASLDVQQAGGMAPGAKIVLYDIPDLSDQSILDAYSTIVETNAVDIVSSSFGGAEGFYTAAYNGGVDYTSILRTLEDIFKQGTAQGITFVASSGDNGGLGLPSIEYLEGLPGGTFLPGIEAPASSPHVTAVGGTNLVTSSVSGSLQSTYVSENAFGDPLVPYDPYGIGNLVAGGYWGSGGGTSVVFAKPGYQFLVNTGSTMRSIPDISLQMGGCPGGISLACGSNFNPPFAESFAITAVGGAFYEVIGTSVSAPEFAGLLALEKQNLGIRLGNVNFQIYALAAAQHIFPKLQTYHQGIPGFNGVFASSSSKGYNMVTGNGTPLGKNFIFAPSVPVAGNPQTPSNP